MPERPPPAPEALRRLREGNRRFVRQMSDPDSRPTAAGRLALLEGQSPIAIVLGCSDSRVPVEIVFDQNLGDLFVIRVAGNIIAPSLVGSVEFAASKFGTRLVVVLGHSNCGVVLSTIEEIGLAPGSQSPNLKAIVERIRPHVEGVLANRSASSDSSEVVTAAVRANIAASVAELQAGSAILADLMANDGLRIVGAEYSLETGVVTFLDAGD